MVLKTTFDVVELLFDVSVLAYVSSSFMPVKINCVFADYLQNNPVSIRLAM